MLRGLLVRGWGLNPNLHSREGWCPPIGRLSQPDCAGYSVVLSAKKSMTVWCGYHTHRLLETGKFA